MTPHLQQIIRLTHTHGSLPEQQLLQRWMPELDAFFQAATPALLQKHIGMEFGIRDTLTLDIKLKTLSRHPSVYVPFLEVLKKIPKIAHWGEFAIQNNRGFHCGLKLTPERLTHEVFMAPARHFLGIPGITDTAFEKAIQTLRSSRIVIDDQEGYGLHIKPLDTTWANSLRNTLGLSNWEATDILPWQHLYFDGKDLLPGQTLLELRPLTLSVLARLTSHYDFPYFRYLIPSRTHKGGTFGRDPTTGQFSLYVQVS